MKEGFLDLVGVCFEVGELDVLSFQKNRYFQD